MAGDLLVSASSPAVIEVPPPLGLDVGGALLVTRWSPAANPLPISQPSLTPWPGPVLEDEEEQFSATAPTWPALRTTWPEAPPSMSRTMPAPPPPPHVSVTVRRGDGAVPGPWDFAAMPPDLPGRAARPGAIVGEPAPLSSAGDEAGHPAPAGELPAATLDLRALPAPFEPVRRPAGVAGPGRQPDPVRGAAAPGTKVAPAPAAAATAAALAPPRRPAALEPADRVAAPEPAQLPAAFEPARRPAVAVPAWEADVRRTSALGRSPSVAPIAGGGEAPGGRPPESPAADPVGARMPAAAGVRAGFPGVVEQAAAGPSAPATSASRLQRTAQPPASPGSDPEPPSWQPVDALAPLPAVAEPVSAQLASAHLPQAMQLHDTQMPTTTRTPTNPPVPVAASDRHVLDDEIYSRLEARLRRDLRIAAERSGRGLV